MEFVEPIRDKKKIDDIRKYLSSNKRDSLLFTLGINSALRVSDLLSLKFEDIVDVNGKPVDYIKLRDTKTNKHNRLPLTKKVKKAIAEHHMENFKGVGVITYSVVERVLINLFKGRQHGR